MAQKSRSSMKNSIVTWAENIKCLKKSCCMKKSSVIINEEKHHINQRNISNIEKLSIASGSILGGSKWRRIETAAGEAAAASGAQAASKMQKRRWRATAHRRRQRRCGVMAERNIGANSISSSIKKISGAWRENGNESVKASSASENGAQRNQWKPLISIWSSWEKRNM